MYEWIIQPWPWYVAGPLIAFVMLGLLHAGESFGVSHNFRLLCGISGAGKFSDYFKLDIKNELWNLAFLGGAIAGGYLAFNHMMESPSVEIAASTTSILEGLGFQNVGQDYLPNEIFGWSQAMTIPGFLLLFGGGLMVGFGARYAGGCTSGHAISGLSNLQLPSLLSVIGFFAGGLLMVHFLFPFIF